MSDNQSNFVPDRHTAESINIASQNDVFRQTFNPKLGKVSMTVGVYNLPKNEKVFLIQQVKNFTDFKQDGNDPYCQHDFGKITIRDNDYFWKIDYYDKSLNYGSENPADPKQTTRVLTIMKASEY